MNSKPIAMFILIVAVSMIFVGSATAARYYVNPGDSIQAAINGADDGDTIILNDGNYTENVIVNKSVAIISKGVDEYYSENVDEYTRYWIFWWRYVSSHNYTYENDGSVTVSALNPRQSIFTVESDDVTIMNIQTEEESSGVYTTYYNYWLPQWNFYPRNKNVTYWEYSCFDNPMGLTGASKSDAASIEVIGADGTQLINLVIYNNDNGIKLIDATDVTIEDVQISDSDKEGITASGCDGVYIHDCTIVDSGKRGIEIDDSVDVDMEHVLVLNSDKSGIDLSSVTGVSMYNVVADGAGKNAICLDQCTDMDIECGAGLNGGRSGLYMNYCDDGYVGCNEFADNDNYGMKIMYTNNVVFDTNDAHDNGEDVKEHADGASTNTWISDPDGCECDDTSVPDEPE